MLWVLHHNPKEIYKSYQKVAWGKRLCFVHDFRNNYFSHRYGPITVNPRKEPSKTLFTGRRSKYEVLSADEDEKRRDRRERNKVAATKCREKRETVLSHLDNQLNGEMNNHKQLLKLIDNLIQQKNYLDSVIENHFNECPLLNNSAPSMIFGDSSFLSSIIDAPPPPLPSYQQEIIDTDEEELSHILDPAPVLTNSAYTTDDSSSALIPPQQPMTNSSIERIINTLQTPTVSMESNHSMLFNSAFGSSCAKQHSSSSEDDSLPPKHTNPYVC
jgi:hypothetical protein